MDVSLFKSKKLWVVGLLLLALAGLAALPLYGSLYVSILMTSIVMYVIVTVSWVLFSGTSGYMSLASAAFFGVGIYTSALLLPNTGAALPLPVVILLAGAVSFVMAVLVGFLTLRLKGIYFAIFTFGLVELVKQLLLWWEHVVSHIRGRFILLVDTDVIFWYMLGIFVVMMLTVYFIRRSKFGLALMSIGENEEAAEHSGVNVTMVKVITFGVSAIFMGMAGAIIATKWTYIDPYIAFNPLFSFLPVLMAIFGGMGQIYGPVIGAAVFAYLQETLQTEFPYVYMLIFGLVLIAAILYLPNGVVGLIPRLVQRWRKGGLAKQHADT
jgi:branched-chain amino acid transport system permease protein